MATIKEVAKTAGVSIATVSNVIHNRNCVSPELTRKVLEAIEFHHYQLNLNASSLKSRKSTSIGLILTRMDSLFFPQVIEGIRRVAEPKGFSISFLISNGSLALEKQHLNTLLGSNVAGIILDSVAGEEQTEYYQEIARLSKERIPIIVLERNMEAWGIDSVFIDNQQGGYMATKHLLERNVLRILHIAAPSGYPGGAERIMGYEKAVKEAGLTPFVIRGEFSSLSGYTIVRQLLYNDVPFGGIFTANDMMALGAIKALQESGIQIPDEVAVVGFDNIFVSSLVSPALSTIRVPIKRMGEVATQILLDKIANSQLPPVYEKFPIRLVVRKTTDSESKADWELF